MSILKKVLPYTDLFLYDIKLFDSEAHKKYVGIDNKLILNNLKELFKLGAKILIRIPVIGGVNGNIDEMKKIKSFLDECGTPEKAELLPYHSMGERKYLALEKEPYHFSIPSSEKMNILKQIF